MGIVIEIIDELCGPALNYQCDYATADILELTNMCKETALVTRTTKSRMEILEHLPQLDRDFHNSLFVKPSRVWWGGIWNDTKERTETV